MGSNRAIVIWTAQCGGQGCGFRFPITSNDERLEHCPLCGSALELIAQRNHPTSGNGKGSGSSLHVEALLDNIRSVYNVGSMFRTADGAGIARLHLAGITTTPQHPKAAKTALGAETTVPWTYHRNGVVAAAGLQQTGARLWAVEDTPQAEPLFELASELPGTGVVLVVGNELAGVDPGILERCDRIVRIPMQGVKRSLNVAVAFGIAAYFLRFRMAASANKTGRPMSGSAKHE